MITHYDLFAGIGGFSLALEEVFDDPIRHIFCEWEQFPTAVLRQHWPDGEFYGDIADLVADTAIERQSGQGQYHRPEHPKTHTSGETNTTSSRYTKGDFTIVTGGFPCQPFSAAGRRKGTADDRYQWPNMFEVIRNTSPDWVIAENVRGLVTWNEGLVLETVCADLEAEGYEVQPFIIPAVSIGAPHRRDRVWIIGHAKHNGQHGSQDGQSDTKKTDSNPAGQDKPKQPKQPKRPNIQGQRAYPDWTRNWQEVAFATCDDSVDDGLSRIVDGVSYSRAKWRQHSLKAYGNGIVHQVATEILRAVKEQQEA